MGSRFDRHGPGLRAQRWHKQSRPRKFVLLLLAFLLLSRNITPAEVDDVRRVLVFNDFDPVASPGVALLDQAIFAAVSQSRYRIEWYDESLGANLFTDEASQRNIREGYVRKYQDRKPDLIIAVGPASLQFMIESHARLFPGVPITFCGSSEEMLERLKPDSDFTGVWGTVQPEETFKAALRLQPTTKHVVVVGGVGAYDRYLERIVKGSLENYESKFEFTYLTDQDMPTLLGRLTRLPTDTIVLYTSIFQDAAGAHFVDANQSTPMVVGAANVPVFVLFDVNFGTGAVGGEIISFASDGKIAGQMAVSILNGEKLGDIPVVKNANVMMFDWRALRRWGFKESDLPPGSVVFYRQFTVWEAYKEYIILGMAVMLAEGVLIFGLLWQRGRRKKSEVQLRESERRFRLAAQAGKMFAYEWDVATDVVVRSGDVADVLGPTSEVSLTRQQILDTVHPDDRARFAASVSERTPDNPNVQTTYRMLGTDGSVVWLEKTAHAFFDEDGRMVRTIGMVSAITERKRAEETLRESEEKFRSVFRDAGVGMVIVSPEGWFLAANGAFCDDLGYTEEELLGKSVESITLADDWPALSKRLSEVLAGRARLQRFEKRCLHKSGRIVFTESTASLIRSHDGKPRYFVGEVLNVTNRREAEETLSNINRKLIEAQEQERTRIGRELHDDITQRLALLAVELAQLQDNPSEVQSRAEKLRKETSEISDDVQALSHELHSSKLEYLGVVAGIRSWCKEFGERQKMKIEFTSDVAAALPFEIGVCLFRVLQEALHNAAKHSEVKHVEVRLLEQSNRVHLIVSDSGKGFDVESAIQGKGLGLTSMRERVRLVNGTIAIESKPMGGTTIEVRVPLESEHSSQRAS